MLEQEPTATRLARALSRHFSAGLLGLVHGAPRSGPAEAAGGRSVSAPRGGDSGGEEEGGEEGDVRKGKGEVQRKSEGEQERQDEGGGDGRSQVRVNRSHAHPKARGTLQGSLS